MTSGGVNLRKAGEGEAADVAALSSPQTPCRCESLLEASSCDPHPFEHGPTPVLPASGFPAFCFPAFSSRFSSSPDAETADPPIP